MYEIRFVRNVTSMALLVGFVFLGLGATVTQAVASSDRTFDGLAPVGDETLAAMHGRDGQISYNITGQNGQQASIADSSISAGGNVTSGALGFTGNAMQNFDGISNFIANTGNNNNLQAGLVVNIILH